MFRTRQHSNVRDRAFVCLNTLDWLPQCQSYLRDHIVELLSRWLGPQVPHQFVGHLFQREDQQDNNWNAERNPSNIGEFLNEVYRIVDKAVENYIERSFTNLTVNFGCTGGQHRSVYSADTLAKHLKEKYGVKVELEHVEQELKGWKN